jgi:hypothetical protein
VQERIKGSWPDTIPVMCQFVHHRLPKNGLMGRVDEHVNPYQTEKEFPLIFGHISNIPPVSPESNTDSVISNFDCSTNSQS